jgi:putative copper export protein
VTLDGVLRFIHFIAAAVWVGGLLTLGALVPIVRRNGGSTDLLRAMARQFGRVSWTAMGVAVVTGVWQVQRLGIDWGASELSLKLGLVVIVIALAAVHQFTARRTSPALRGAIQGVILLVSLGIVAAAVAL